MISKNDEKAINELLAKMRFAWADGNGQQYGSCFIPDAHCVEAPGHWVTGNQTIAERHQRIFDTFFKHTRIDGTYTTQWQSLTPDVVLIHGEGNVLFRGETSQDVQPNGLTTICLLRKDDQWKIASFQNTPAGRWRSLKLAWRFFSQR